MPPELACSAQCCAQPMPSTILLCFLLSCSWMRTAPWETCSEASWTCPPARSVSAREGALQRPREASQPLRIPSASSLTASWAPSVASSGQKWEFPVVEAQGSHESSVSVFSLPPCEGLGSARAVTLPSAPRPHSHPPRGEEQSPLRLLHQHVLGVAPVPGRGSRHARGPAGLGEEDPGGSSDS